MSDLNVTDQKLQLEKFLPYRLSVLSNRISRSISDRYEQRFSLTLAEWRTLAVLGENSELSAAQVAERTAMDKVAISRAVNNLIKKGRIDRYFSEDDRRRSVLALSSVGRDIYQQVVPMALAYERDILQELSKEEQKFLHRILKKLDAIQLHTV